MIHKTKRKRNYGTISHEQPQPCTSSFSAIVFPHIPSLPLSFPFHFSFPCLCFFFFFSNSLCQIKLLVISWAWLPFFLWVDGIRFQKRKDPTKPLTFIHMTPPSRIIFSLHIYKGKKQDWAFNHRSSVARRSLSFCSPMVSLLTKMSKASFIHQCLHTSLASATGIWLKRK